jgi:hypothetical protein
MFKIRRFLPISVTCWQGQMWSDKLYGKGEDASPRIAFWIPNKACHNSQLIAWVQREKFLSDPYVCAIIFASHTWWRVWGLFMESSKAIHGPNQVHMWITILRKEIWGWAPVAHPCNSSYAGAEIRRIAVWSQCWQIVLKTLSQKNPSQQKTGQVAQVVECLSSKHESLGSNLTTAPLP